jgi:hypothetical protein
MAIQLNVGLTTKDGGTVDAGSRILFDVNFQKGVYKYNVNLELWRTQQAYIDGLQPIRGIQEIPQLYFEKELSFAEYSGLTPIVIHNHVKAYLETYVGEGNTSIVI